MPDQQVRARPTFFPESEERHPFWGVDEVPPGIGVVQEVLRGVLLEPIQVDPLLDRRWGMRDHDRRHATDYLPKGPNGSLRVSGQR